MWRPRQSEAKNAAPHTIRPKAFFSRMIIYRVVRQWWIIRKPSGNLRKPRKFPAGFRQVSEFLCLYNFFQFFFINKKIRKPARDRRCWFPEVSRGFWIIYNWWTTQYTVRLWDTWPQELRNLQRCGFELGPIIFRILYVRHYNQWIACFKHTFWRPKMFMQVFRNLSRTQLLHNSFWIFGPNSKPQKKRDNFYGLIGTSWKRRSILNETSNRLLSHCMLALQEERGQHSFTSEAIVFSSRLFLMK